MKKSLLFIAALSLATPKANAFDGSTVVLLYVGFLKLATVVASTCAAYEIYHQSHKPAAQKPSLVQTLSQQSEAPTKQEAPDISRPCLDMLLLKD